MNAITTWHTIDPADQSAVNRQLPGILREQTQSIALHLIVTGPVSLTSKGYIEATGDHPEMYGYMVGPDDGKSVLSRTPGEALKESGISRLRVSGQTGPDAKPLHPSWVRSLRDQCLAAGVPFEFGGWGEWKPFVKLNGLDDLPNNTPVCLVKPDGRVVRPYSREEAVGQQMVRVGPERSGRVLDGRTWDGEGEAP